MKRRLAAVSTGVIAAVALSACGGGGAGGPADAGAQTSPPPKDIDTTLTIWSYNEPKDFPYIDTWIERFNETYPNVEIDWVWTEQQRLTSKLLGSAISEDAPDGIFFNPAAAPQLADAGVLRDLTPYWSDYEHREQFADSVVTQYNDQVLAVQPYVNISTIWYNQDILDEIGATPSDPPMSVAEFEDALAAADEAGYTGLTMACEPSEKGEFSALPWFLSEGVNYGNWEQGPTAAVFSRFSDWSQQGYLPKDCVGWTGGVAFERFLAGEVAFTYNGNWQLSAAEEGADFEYGVMPMPAGAAGSHSIPGGEAVGITQGAEHPALLWEFWKVALSEQGQLAALESNGSIPSRGDLADAPGIQDSPILQTYAEVVAGAGQRPPSPEIYKGMQALGRTFNAVVGGQLDGAEAAQQLRQETSSIG